jgi:5-methylcytosine-specific restriction endonuclease McrA
MRKKKRVSSVSDTIFGVPKMKATKNPLYTDFPSLYPKQTQKDSRRRFTETQKNAILARQHYKCAECGKKLDPRAKHIHHIKPWSSGGKTIVENGRALCPTCHAKETQKEILNKVDKKRKPKSTNLLF